jgi:preprotein translocase subunit SecB
MADQQPTNEGNGSGAPDGEPQVAVIAQYIKDLSVENPSAPQVFQWQVQPNVDVQFNINVEKLGDDVHEIVLKMEVSARSENGVHFVVDLSYGGLFGLRNIPEEALPPFLLVEGPGLILLVAGRAVCGAGAKTSFAALTLDPIDFAGAYLAQVEPAQGQGGGSNGSGDAPAPETPSEA